MTRKQWVIKTKNGYLTKEWGETLFPKGARKFKCKKNAKRFVGIAIARLGKPCKLEYLD